jgi:UDP-2,3-diacylglucosamine hydrolase
MAQTSDNNVLGLIAGQGRLPFIVARGARKAGKRVVCAALDGNASPELAEACDEFCYVPLAKMGRWIKFLKSGGAQETIMVGRVAKKRLQKASIPRLIAAYMPDWRTLRTYFWRLRGKTMQNDTLLSAIADELSSGGIILTDSTKYSKDQLADKGVMTKTQPSRSVEQDIEFGWEIVKKIGELDIGQSVAVKDKDVIAVEAIEGTARMISRAGGLCKKGRWTLLKAPRSSHDMRFDVPCVGPDTIRSLHEHGAAALVVEAENTFIIDKPETLELADKLKIAVIGR